MKMKKVDDLVSHKQNKKFHKNTEDRLFPPGLRWSALHLSLEARQGWENDTEKRWQLGWGTMMNEALEVEDFIQNSQEKTRKLYG